MIARFSLKLLFQGFDHLDRRLNPDSFSQENASVKTHFCLLNTHFTVSRETMELIFSIREIGKCAWPSNQNRLISPNDVQV